MRQINYIVAHCTATPQTATVESIKNYWQNTLGWLNPGYHYLIDTSGNKHQLQDEKLTANGVRGENHHAIHLAYIGGIDAQGNAIDNRTVAQKTSLKSLIIELQAKYPLAKIQGHRDFPGVAKACPCFDAREEYREL